LSLPAVPLSPFFRVLAAEVRLTLKGLPWWWYLGALGLIIAGALNGSNLQAQQGLLSAAWIWPVLVWSGLGVREKSHQTGMLVFSAPHPLTRQLPASWVAGVLVTLLTGSGVGLGLLFAGDVSSLLGWLAAVVFIPTLALALGIWTGNSKTFEALYVVLWYIGPVSGLAELDYMGISPEAIALGMPRFYLLITLGLLGLAFLGRKRQVN
jgi:hypothetical protein